MQYQLLGGIWEDVQVYLCCLWLDGMSGAVRHTGCPLWGPGLCPTAGAGSAHRAWLQHRPSPGSHQGREATSASETLGSVSQLGAKSQGSLGFWSADCRSMYTLNIYIYIHTHTYTCAVCVCVSPHYSYLAMMGKLQSLLKYLIEAVNCIFSILPFLIH